METNQKTSRKRKQTSPPSISPFTGILTRQKNQKYFFSSNRSGKSRKCRAFQPPPQVNAVPQTLTVTAPPYDGKKGDNSGDNEDEEMYHISIKDLRARRVFSKPPKEKSLGKIDDNSNLSSELVDCKLDYCFEGMSLGFGGKPGLDDCGFSVLKKCDLGINGGNPSLVDLYVEGVNGGNPNLLKGSDLGIDGGDSNLLMSAVKYDDYGVDLMSEALNGENPNLLKSSDLGVDGGESNLSMSVKKCDDYGVNLMSKGSDGGSPELSRGCDLGFNGGNSNLSMSSRKWDDHDVDLMSQGQDLSVGGPDLLIASEKCQLVKECDATVVDGMEGLNDGNPNFSEKCDLGVDSVGKAGDELSPVVNNKELKTRVGDSYEVPNDENVQTTPPEAVVLIKKNGEQNVLQSRSSVSRSLTNRVSPTKDGGTEAKKNWSNSKKNTTLNLCSRLKVYKAPNSFSYRRLLPFLMDMAKDEPCEGKGEPTVVEQKPAVFSSGESIADAPKLDEMHLVVEAASVPQETSTDRNDRFSLDPKTSDVITQETAVQGCSATSAADPSSQVAALERPTTIDPATQMVQTLNATDPTTQQSAVRMPVDCSVMRQTNVVSRQLENQTPYDSDNVISHDDQISSGILVHIGDATRNGQINVEAKLDSPKGSPEASMNELSLVSCALSCGVGNSRATRTEIQAEKSPANLSLSPSKLAARVSSGALGGPGQGILKRNPRGCRGICSCLNCASFRLNAEKAFEFSRNQLLEAEEVTQDLMRELSNLRHMLGRSLTGASNHIPATLVEEACRKASSTEDAARSCLSQMKEDFYVHCRTKALQRPRVNFSGNVLEKVTDEQTKQQNHNVSTRSVRLIADSN